MMAEGRSLVLLDVDNRKSFGWGRIGLVAAIDPWLRYEAFRDEARERVQASLNVGVRFQLTGVDELALEVWRRDWRVKGPKSFDWDDVKTVLGNQNDCFEVAIWCGDKLCGLAMGRCSGGPDNVTIHFIERLWEGNPLARKVAEIVLNVAYEYARIMQKRWVKLKDPIPEAIALYASLGFRLVEPKGRTIFCVRQVVQP
jgi:hypothetical protein